MDDNSTKAMLESVLGKGKVEKYKKLKDELLAFAESQATILGLSSGDVLITLLVIAEAIKGQLKEKSSQLGDEYH